MEIILDVDGVVADIVTLTSNYLGFDIVKKGLIKKKSVLLG